MSKARAIAESYDYASGDNLDAGSIEPGTLQDGNVYSVMDTIGVQTFDGGTV